MLWVVRTTISGWTNERTRPARVPSFKVARSRIPQVVVVVLVLLVATRARVRSITSTNRLHLGEAAARQGAATQTASRVRGRAEGARGASLSTLRLSEQEGGRVGARA
jgi:hypothetical protein